MTNSINLLQLLGGFGPIIFGLALLVALRILSDPLAPTIRDATQQALYVIGCTLIAVGVLGTILLSFGTIVAVVAAVVCCLALYRRRRAQQYAFLSLLAATAERLMPLVPAIEAFSCEYRGGIGTKARRLAHLLRAGQPLPFALKQCRGLVPRDVLPLLQTGYEAGALAAALRGCLAVRNSHEPMRDELLSRTAYLLGLVLYFYGVAFFMLLKITPAFEKILADFGVPPPALTQIVFGVVNGAALCSLLVLPIVVMLLFYLLLRSFGLIHWRLPGMRRFVRRLDTAAILDALSIVVDRRRPMPDSLRSLAESYPNRGVRTRLRCAAAEAESGASWSQSLLNQGLLAQADLAVLESAARVGNLSWAMHEMADSNRRRWVYRARMWLQATFPLVILGVGSAVGLYIVGYFLPLIAMIERLM